MPTSWPTFEPRAGDVGIKEQLRAHIKDRSSRRAYQPKVKKVPDGFRPVRDRSREMIRSVEASSKQKRMSGLPSGSDGYRRSNQQRGRPHSIHAMTEDLRPHGLTFGISRGDTKYGITYGRKE
jgi:hypothetical protein